MPYLQLDLPCRLPPATKRTLAARLITLYADTMQTRPALVNVGFRELGPDNLFRQIDDALVPAAVIHCDVRRGRAPEQRQALAAGLVAACAAALGLPPGRVVVEFTQHAADEMYRDGAWGQEWTSAEGVE